jgi:hypothetical protein
MPDQAAGCSDREQRAFGSPGRVPGVARPALSLRTYLLAVGLWGESAHRALRHLGEDRDEVEETCVVAVRSGLLPDVGVLAPVVWLLLPLMPAPLAAEALCSAERKPAGDCGPIPRVETPAPTLRTYLLGAARRCGVRVLSGR